MRQPFASDLEPIIVVGALARVETELAPLARRELETLDGVDTFDVSDSHQLGILIEADSLDAAHRRLREDVETVHGVLAVWPVAIELGEDHDEERYQEEAAEPTGVRR